MTAPDGRVSSGGSEATASVAEAQGTGTSEAEQCGTGSGGSDVVAGNLDSAHGQPADMPGGNGGEAVSSPMDVDEEDEREGATSARSAAEASAPGGGSSSSTIGRPGGSNGNPDRRLCVTGVPLDVQSIELADFLSGAVLAAAGHANTPRPADVTPCVGCEFRAAADGTTKVANAVFRTALAASVALRLDGLACRDAPLSLRRPPEFHCPSGQDPAAAVRLEDVLLEDLLGMPRSADDVFTMGSADAAQAPSHSQPADATGAPSPAENAAAQSETPEFHQEQSQPPQREPQQPPPQPDPPQSQSGAATGRPQQQQQKQQQQQQQQQQQEQQRPPVSEEKPPADHYEALGISQRATLTEVKKAYHTKCRLLHPDKNHNDPGTTARFQRVAEAYQVLSSPLKRAQYDATLVMQKACGNLGVQHDPRAAAFVQRHSAAAGREVQGLQLESRHVGNLVGKNGYQLQQLKQQSGADILVLQNQLSVYAQVLIAGTTANIQRAKQLIQACVAELTGMQAPRDGVVLLVPQQSLVKMPLVAAQFQAIFLQTGAAARFATADRIVVQGGMRVPQAVVQLQWILEWRGHLLLPNGTQMDPWTYAHFCEAAANTTGPVMREHFAILLPPADPDAAVVRHLMCFALGLVKEANDKTPLVELAIRAMQAHHAGRPVTGALVRAATSVAVHAEHSGLSMKEGAPLLCALVAIWPSAGTMVAPRFGNSPLFKTLMHMGDDIQNRESVALRARGFTAMREAVPGDFLWHSWDSLAVSEGLLATFWKDLQKWTSDRRQTYGLAPLPDEWFGVPQVMVLFLRSCAERGVELDPAKGIRRPISQQPVPVTAVPPRAPQQAVRQGTENQQPATEESRNEEDETLTILEHAEEVLFNLTRSDAHIHADLGRVSQEVQKRHTSTAERLSKKWYESHKGSFELKRIHLGSGSDEWHVRLTAPAQARANARIHERQAEAQRKRELTVADQVLPMLSADNLPRTLRSPELAGLLCVLSRGQYRVDDLPAALLRRLCRRGDATPKELLQESTPFPPARIMRAIVALEKQRRERWDKDALDMVLQAAALDMHAVDDRPRAALPTAASALWAAARKPFDDRLNDSKCLLVPSAALRLQVELAEPAALSPEASAFRPFAQMCAWLAHLVVTAVLPTEVRSEVLQAFKKLASACEELGQQPETAPCDPEGLCRLAMAVALVVRDEKGDFGTEALEGLARICVQRAMDEALHWRPQQLSVLASAYAAAEVPHEGLFRTIGMAAERHTALGNEWTTEQLLKLLHSGWQLGQLGALEKLLRSLHADAGLQRYVREAAARDLPLLFSVLVLINDLQMLEELLRSQREKLHSVSMQGLTTMLREWPQKEGGGPALAHTKATVVREAVAAAGRKAPSLAELQILVDAASEDSKALSRLTELAASPALLTSMPPVDTSWQELRTALDGLLAPFADAGVEVPRLEAACAARLVTAMERSPAEPRELATAILVLHENVFASMPIFIEAVAESLAKTRLPSKGLEAAEVRRLCTRLVRAAAKVGRGNANRGSGDQELDNWVDRLDRCVFDDGRPGSERRLDWLETQACKRFAPAAREALGSSWMTTLLIRSKRLAWTGGKTVSLNSPKPRAAVRKLSDVGSTLLFDVSLQAEVGALEPDTVERALEASPRPAGALGPAGWSPGAGSSGARTAAPTPSRDAAGGRPSGTNAAAPTRSPASGLQVTRGWDKGMADTIAGTYAPFSNNHHRIVYRRIDPKTDSNVLLYYWDERDGEEQRGWWFGPEVGGEEVWAHNSGSSTSTVPPARGWRILHSGTVDPALTVTKVDNQRIPGGAAVSTAAPSTASVARTIIGSAPSQVRSNTGVPTRPPPPPPRPRGSAGMIRRQGGEAQPPATPSRSRVPTPTSTGGIKRPRIDSARAAELHSWLQGLDDGAGAMLQYFDVLSSEFDADLAQIAAAKVEGGEKQGILGVVDPSFWETVRVEKTGHKMLFARGIAKL